jgi:hypothetical protein
MRLTLLSVFFLFILIGFTLTANSQVLKTTKYAGIYAFGTNIENGPGGRMTIFPETDSTVLFYLDISRGAPSYNLGQLYNRLIIKNNKATYYSKENYDQKGCKWQITINDKILIIKTLDDCYDCGFGANIYADNHYTRKDNKIPVYFIDGHGNKIYFKNTSPENYLR